MNIISPLANNKQAHIMVRPLTRKKKIIDIQTVTEVFDEGVYQLPQISGTVIDLGANIGVFSVYACLMGAEKVYAVEPNPSNYKLLEQNINLNNLETKVISYMATISNREGTILLNDMDRDSRVKAVSRLESAYSKKITKAKDKTIFESPTTTLEKFLDDLDVQDCIVKADVEWSEYIIFTKMKKEAMDKISYLTMEFHGTSKGMFGRLVANLSQSFCLDIVGSYERGGYIRARRY